jgi:sugar fermentation stimulation protein A
MQSLKRALALFEMSADMILIPFHSTCITAQFICRHKRFSIEAHYQGERIWAHTNNTGSMMGLLKPGQDIFLSLSPNPKRKLPYTLELVKVHDMWVGVNTLTPNRILKLAWQQKQVKELLPYNQFLSEVKFGNSRFDACVFNANDKRWIEAKNVTLVEDDIAAFPDAITTRGQKHLETLIQIKKSGIDTSLFFFIQRTDGKCFAPADYIDTIYADLFYDAMHAGVQIWPYQAVITTEGIGIGQKLDILDKQY